MRTYRVLSRRCGSHCAWVRAWRVRRVSEVVVLLVSVVALAAPSPALAALSGSGTQALVEASPASAGHAPTLARAYTIVVDGEFVHNWQITSEDPSSGAFSGTGTVEDFTESFTGSVSGNSVQFTSTYNTGYVWHGKGTVASDGSWSGTFTDSLHQSGPWQATPLQVTGPPYQVSGTVTEQGSNGQGVSGVPVHANCLAGGSTTSTDASGNYSFLLDPGRCRIAPQVSEGTTSIPKELGVDVVDHDISGVDFEVGCSGAGAAGDGVDATEAAAAGGSDCKLNVVVQPSGPGLAGLGWKAGSSQSDAEFLSASSLGISSFATCVGGCENVQVTVTDAKTHKPVQGAQLTAEVSAFPAAKIAQYPGGGGSGQGRLCVAGSFAGCGLSISGITTDRDGRAELVYWAPGVIGQHDIKITVTAKHACDQSVCRLREQTGKGYKDVTIRPYVIFSNEGTLKHDDLEVLESWAENPENFRSLIGQGRDAAAEHALSYALGLAAEAMEHAVPIAGPALLAGELAHELYTSPKEFKEISSTIGVEQAISTLFTNPTGLLPAGLGTPQALEMDPAYLEAIAGEHGLLREYGLRLIALADHGFNSPTQVMRIKLTDVSYCQSGVSCGPGVDPPGMQPYVELDFTGYAPANGFQAGFTALQKSIVMPFNPELFDVLQFKGQPPPALGVK